MGERVREGQAGINPVVEASERGLLAGSATLPVAWAQPRDAGVDPVAVAATSAATEVPSRHPWLQQGSRLLAGRTISRRSKLAAIETELDRGAAFLLFPVFLALGALIYFALPAEPALPPLAIASTVAALLAFFVRSQRLVHYGLAVLATCLLGLTVAKLETTRVATKMLGAEISTGITARVIELDHLDNGRVRLTLDILATARPVLRYAPQRVRLTARKVPEGVVAGAQVSGYVRLMPPSGPVRPGSYDFSFESYFDGIGASGFFMKGPDLAATTQPLSASDRALASIENVRDEIAQRIRDRIGGAEGEIAAALVVGVRGGIPEDVNEALRRTGLYHIISISGLHMAMVAGTVMVLMRLAFAGFANFSSRWPVKKYAACAALVATAGYLFISGAEVAAQRSFIMLAVMLTAVLFDRAALTMRNLAVSAIVVILVSPHEVVGPSFQMSFAATAALVGAYAWWSDRREQEAHPPVQRSLPAKIWRWLVTVTIGLIATSLIAGLATSVFGAWHFQRVSPLSLVANLAVMPIVSVLVMPFAVLAGIFMPLGLDGVFLDKMGLGLKAMLALSKWFSERSPVDAVGLVSAHAVVLVTAALVVASIATTWLRFVAIPFAVFGILSLVETEMPVVLVSEDGRLVGAPTGDKKLAVNRARPNEFTVDNWRRALVAEEVVGPLRANPDQSVPMGLHNSSDSNGPQAAFVCSDGLCLVQHPSAGLVAHAEHKIAASRACASADLIIVNDATVKDICPSSEAAVLTSRQLARLGSAAVFSKPVSVRKRRQLEIRHAVAEPYRPWHTQRAFSREARGLPPYLRTDKRSKTPDTADHAK